MVPTLAPGKCFPSDLWHDTRRRAKHEKDRCKAGSNELNTGGRSYPGLFRVGKDIDRVSMVHEDVLVD